MLMYVWTFELIGSDYSGARFTLYTSYSEKARWKVGETLEGLGFPDNKGVEAAWNERVRSTYRDKRHEGGRPRANSNNHQVQHWSPERRPLGEGYSFRTLPLITSAKELHQPAAMPAANSVQPRHARTNA